MSPAPPSWWTVACSLAIVPGRHEDPVSRPMCGVELAAREQRPWETVSENLSQGYTPFWR